MAQFQYDAVLGADKTKVVRTNGAAISTSVVRLTLDTTNAKNKHDVLKALQAVTQNITEGKWPPA